MQYSRGGYDATKLPEHVRSQLSTYEADEGVRRTSRLHGVCFEDVRLSGPGTIEIVLTAASRPGGRFAWRFEAVPEDPHRWTPPEWATVVAANLVERIASGSGGFPSSYERGGLTLLED